MISTLAYLISTAQNQVGNSSKIFGVVKSSRTLGFFCFCLLGGFFFFVCLFGCCFFFVSFWFFGGVVCLFGCFVCWFGFFCFVFFLFYFFTEPGMQWGRSFVVYQSIKKPLRYCSFWGQKPHTSKKHTHCGTQILLALNSFSFWSCCLSTRVPIHWLNEG